LPSTPYTAQTAYRLRHHPVTLLPPTYPGSYRADWRAIRHTLHRFRFTFNKIYHQFLLYSIIHFHWPLYHNHSTQLSIVTDRYVTISILNYQ